MRFVPPAVQAIMNQRSFLVAELYTFTLADGAGTLRYGDYHPNQPTLVLDGNQFPTSGLKFKRGKTKQAAGLEVSTMTLDVYADPDDPSSQIGGLSFASFARSGGFDGSYIQVDKCFMNVWGDCATNGAMMWFIGRAADIAFGRTTVSMTVKALTELLNQQMPRDTYQPGCLNTLYEPSTCKVVKSTFAVTGSVTAGATKSVIPTTLTNPDSWFTLGSIKFTSGVLAVLPAHTITAYGDNGVPSGSLRVPLPYPVPPAPGDTFTAFPGCDKAQATCQNKFSNLPNFRGFPFIPVQETAR